MHRGDSFTLTEPDVIYSTLTTGRYRLNLQTRLKRRRSRWKTQISFQDHQHGKVSNWDLSFNGETEHKTKAETLSLLCLIGWVTFIAP